MWWAIVSLEFFLRPIRGPQKSHFGEQIASSPVIRMICCNQAPLYPLKPDVLQRPPHFLGRWGQDLSPRNSTSAHSPSLSLTGPTVAVCCTFRESFSNSVISFFTVSDLTNPGHVHLIQAVKCNNTMCWIILNLTVNRHGATTVSSLRASIISRLTMNVSDWTYADTHTGPVYHWQCILIHNHNQFTNSFWANLFDPIYKTDQSIPPLDPQWPTCVVY